MINRVLRWLLAILAVLAIPIGESRLWAQEAQACEDMVREFKRFYPKMRSIEERVEAVHSLETAQCPAAVRQLVKLLSDRRSEIVEAAHRVLLKLRKPDSVTETRAALQSATDPILQSALIKILVELEDRSSLQAIVEVAFASSSGRPVVRFRAAQALGVLGDASYQQVLAETLNDRDVLVRMAGAESVGKLKLTGLREQLLELLEDSSWQVVAAAVQSLGSVRHADSIDPLIALMRKGGRIQEDCADSLFKITGMDIGLYPDTWQQVMATLRGGSWRIPSDAELAKKAASRQRYRALYDNQPEGLNSFGGIVTSSRRLLFIIDISGSMEDEVVERENFDGEYPNFQKLTIVKTELIRTIESLEPSTRFNIVAFASDLQPWKKSLVPANAINRASARSWVGRLQALGGSESQSLAAGGLSGSANLAAGKTNTYKALMHPFGFDPDKPKTNRQVDSKAVMSNPIDTVYFLSDGRPSTGKVVDQAEILDAVRRRNESYRLVINCIAIGEFQKAFLKSLAQITGGVFVDLGQ